MKGNESLLKRKKLKFTFVIYFYAIYREKFCLGLKIISYNRAFQMASSHKVW